MSPCGARVMKQNGSPASKRTTPGRVNFQFIVNGNGSQSVSTRPSSGTIPSLTQLGAPRAQTAQPGEVLNSQPVWNVTTPWPKCEVTSARIRGSVQRNWTVERSSPPYHAASNANGSAISQPLALAIESGMQR